VNKMNEATSHQQVPLKDANVVVDPFEVALDSDQICSINDLLGFMKDFVERDKISLTRPKESIAQLKSDASADPMCKEMHRLLVKAWWQHALRGVRLKCNMPVPHLDATELRKKSQLRVQYLNLCRLQYSLTEQADTQGSTKAVDADMLHELNEIAFG